MKKILLGLVIAVGLFAQQPPYSQPMIQLVGNTLPVNCNNGDIFYNAGTFVTYRCGPTQTWTVFGGSGSGNVTASGSLANTAIVTGASGTIIQTPNTGATLDVSGFATLPGGVASSATPPSVTVGTGGTIAGSEGTGPSVCAATGVDCLWFSSTQHGLLANFNNAGIVPIVQGPNTAASGHVAVFVGTTGGILSDGGVGTLTIASGSSALGTSGISATTCATVVTGVATGTLSTDTIIWTPNASLKAVTGYVPASGGPKLTITSYPTADTVNFDVCNWTSGTVTPGAVTLNWRVVR
jgi:hypothetical protein